MCKWGTLSADEYKNAFFIVIFIFIPFLHTMLVKMLNKKINDLQLNKHLFLNPTELVCLNKKPHWSEYLKIPSFIEWGLIQRFLNMSDHHYDGRNVAISALS